MVRGECVNPALRCVTLNVYANAGTVRRISGWEQIKKMKDCRLVMQHAHIGQVCSDDQAILSKLGMAYFCSDSLADLKEDVREFYEHFEAVDENGNDMVYDRVDPDYIEKWYSGEVLHEL